MNPIDPNYDRRLQEQIAKDLRFLAYRHGKPMPPVVIFLAAIVGLVLLIAAAGLIGRFSAWLSGDSGHPQRIHRATQQ